MPNLTSAKKRLRQDVVRKVRNRANKSRLKSAMKRYIKALETDVTTAEKELSFYTKVIDISARKNTIPKLRADRKKSRAALALERVKAGKSHGLTIDAYRPQKRPK